MDSGANSPHMRYIIKVDKDEHGRPKKTAAGDWRATVEFRINEHFLCEIRGFRIPGKFNRCIPPISKGRFGEFTVAEISRDLSDEIISKVQTWVEQNVSQD